MEKLKAALELLDENVSRETLDKFSLYMDMVLEWNKHVNLTAITDKDEFVIKHFIDSLLCINFEQYKSAFSIIDVGTGAGFPGIPLALLSPDKKFVLFDSLNKRIKILEEVCDKLNIKNVVLLHGRAEELAQNKMYREHYDLCVSRAVAKLSVLSEYCLPFVRVGGNFLAYKGSDYENEIDEAAHAINVLGGTVQKVRPVKMVGFDFEHQIICINKKKSTGAKYPRKAGTPSKEPL